MWRNRFMRAFRPPTVPAPGWTPANGTFWAWFDADDPATITEVGADVTQWNDKSGNARHITPQQGGIGFDLQASIQNGKPGMYTTNSGSDRRFMGIDTITLAQPFTVYVAFRIGTLAVSGFASIFEGDIDVTGSRAIFFLRRSDVGDDPCIYGGTLQSINATPLATSTAYYMTGVYNGASSSGSVNGVASGTLNTGTFGIVDGFLFGSGGLDGHILECLIEPDAGTERTNVETYLAAKWGI